MLRTKTFDATGVAPNGKLFAGDLNAIQDAAAALADLTQDMQIRSVAIGEAGLGLSRYAAGEALLSGILRLSGRLRGLGGVAHGTFTSSQRDAISSPDTGLVIWNSDNARLEQNIGTPGAPNWQALTPPATYAINQQTGAYTLALADAGKVIEVNSAGAATLTIPNNSTVAFPIGTPITIAQYGVGQVTVVGAAGVTLRGNRQKTASQYAMGQLFKRATNEWYVAGDMVP